MRDDMPRVGQTDYLFNGQLYHVIKVNNKTGRALVINRNYMLGRYVIFDEFAYRRYRRTHPGLTLNYWPT
jgi:hypothetical protein